MKAIDGEALESAATLLRGLRLDNGVGRLLSEQERRVYRAIEELVNEALESDEDEEE